MELSRKCIEQIKNNQSSTEILCSYYLQVVFCLFSNPQIIDIQKSTNTSKPTVLRYVMIIFLMNCRFFLWDGEQYSTLFFLSEKLVNAADPLIPGNVIHLQSFRLIPPNSQRILITRFQKITSFTYILNTPLSIDAIPKPVTSSVFANYLSMLSHLPLSSGYSSPFDSASQEKQEKQQDKIDDSQNFQENQSNLETNHSDFSVEEPRLAEKRVSPFFSQDNLADNIENLENQPSTTTDWKQSLEEIHSSNKRP